VTISALATAGGTLVLAGATFASVRSANRAAVATRAPIEEFHMLTRDLYIPANDVGFWHGNSFPSCPSSADPGGKKSIGRGA
jgi:hypothetical protein